MRGEAAAKLADDLKKIFDTMKETNNKKGCISSSFVSIIANNVK